MRQQRNSEKERQEMLRRKRRRKKIIGLIILFLMLIAVAAECFVLLRMTSIDMRFVRNVQRGVHAGWALQNDELQLQQLGKITDISFIEAEYEAIADYRNRRYKDDELGRLANEYIKAVTACRKAARRHSPDKSFDAFWNDFSEPYGKRVRVLYQLETGDFGMSLDSEEYSQEYYNLIAQGWLLDKIDRLVFGKTETRDGLVFSVDIPNDSGYDIEYINLDIELMDANGKTVETASAYAEGIPAGGNIDLTFQCTAKKAAKYRIVGEVCKLGAREIETETEDEQGD